MNVKLVVLVLVVNLKLVLPDFTKFQRDDMNDGMQCYHPSKNAFNQNNCTLARCLMECEVTTDCVGIFYFPESLKCHGCSTYIFKTSSLASQYYRKPLLPGYVGCYKDRRPRVLNGYEYYSFSMTNELSQQTSFNRGFLYAGTQWGQECYCGNSYNTSDIPDESLCTKLCVGDNTQYCGQSYTNSIYRVRIV